MLRAPGCRTKKPHKAPAVRGQAAKVKPLVSSMACMMLRITLYNLQYHQERGHSQDCPPALFTHCVQAPKKPAVKGFTDSNKRWLKPKEDKGQAPVLEEADEESEEDSGVLLPTVPVLVLLELETKALHCRCRPTRGDACRHPG